MPKVALLKNVTMTQWIASADELRRRTGDLHFQAPERSHPVGMGYLLRAGDAADMMKCLFPWKKVRIQQQIIRPRVRRGYGRITATERDVAVFSQDLLAALLPLACENHAKSWRPLLGGDGNNSVVHNRIFPQHLFGIEAVPRQGVIQPMDEAGGVRWLCNVIIRDKFGRITAEPTFDVSRYRRVDGTMFWDADCAFDDFDLASLVFYLELLDTGSSFNVDEEQILRFAIAKYFDGA